MSSETSANNDTYIPPTVWQPDVDGKGIFSGINRPTAGARSEKELPVGKHPFQLYSLGTPNGQKITILFEELLAVGVSEAEYDAWLIRIMEQDQFGSGFVAVNPNSKIPALMDYSNRDHPVRVFESGNILLYLAERFGKFIPNNNEHGSNSATTRTEVLNWLFWQMASAPLLGGGFGHFFKYAPTKQKYPIDRYTMEAKRQLDVLNQQLSKSMYIAGDEYTIADIAIFPWYGLLLLGEVYGTEVVTFLNAENDYPHVMRWARHCMERPAVRRGMIVNRTWGGLGQLKERHTASDIDQALEQTTEGK